MANGEASIWNPRTLLQLSSDTKRIEEKLTAIAGQTLFTLKDFAYVVDTGSLAIYLLTKADMALGVKGGRLLKEGVDWAEGTASTFSLVIAALAGDQITAVGYVAITANVDVRDTDIFISNYQAIRDYAGTEITLYAQGTATHADGGESFFNKVTGAAPGTHVDNNSDVIVPTGGDGSIAWLKVHVVEKLVVDLAAAIADPSIAVGDRYIVDERIATFGGKGIWDAVDATTVTENEIDIVTVSATVSLKLLVEDVLSISQLGGGQGGPDDVTKWDRGIALCRNDVAIWHIPKDADTWLASQVVWFDDLHIHWEGKVTRNWTTTATDKRDKATFRNEHAPASTSYIINPGPFVPSSVNNNITVTGNGKLVLSAAAAAAATGAVFAGPHLAIMACNNQFYGPISLHGGCNEWATILWGDNITFDNIKVRDQVEIFEDGIHVLSGDNITGSVDAESGDDAFAAINNYNLPISNVNVEVKSDSNKGYAVRIGLNRTGVTAAFGPVTEKAKGINITVVGKAGKTRNGLILIQTDSANANYDTVEKVTINCHLEHGDVGGHDGINPYGAILDGGKDIEINGTFINVIRSSILSNNTTNVRYNINTDAPQSASFRTVDLLDCEETVLDGSYPANTVQAVTIDGGSTDIKAILSEIPTGSASVRAQNAAIINYYAKVKRASGATSVRVIRNESTTSEIYMGGTGLDVTDVDFIMQFIADPLVYRTLGGRGLKKTVAIISDIISVNGLEEVDMLTEGTAPDTLSFLNTMQKGQKLTIRNGEADPVTNTISVDDSLGNIVMSASPYVINDSDKVLKVEDDGTNVQEVTRY